MVIVILQSHNTLNLNRLKFKQERYADILGKDPAYSFNNKIKTHLHDRFFWCNHGVITLQTQQDIIEKVLSNIDS